MTASLIFALDDNTLSDRLVSEFIDDYLKTKGISNIEAWVSTVTYNEGRITQTTDGDYAVSVIDSNVGNDPDDDDGTNWYLVKQHKTIFEDVDSQTELDAIETAFVTAFAKVTTAFGTHGLNDVLINDSEDDAWETFIDISTLGGMGTGTDGEDGQSGVPGLGSLTTAQLDQSGVLQSGRVRLTNPDNTNSQTIRFDNTNSPFSTDYLSDLETGLYIFLKGQSSDAVRTGIIDSVTTVDADDDLVDIVFSPDIIDGDFTNAETVVLGFQESDSSGSGGSGLSSVSTDATLDGDGTASDTLGIADDGVDTDQIADDAVTQSKIANNAVGNPAMLSNAIDTPEIVNDAVTQAKIANDAVGAAQIENDAVDTEHITDEAIRDEHVADDLSPNEQSNIRTKIGAGAGTTTNLTEEQVIDKTSTVFGQVSGIELFHVVRRHAPDVVPARFTTVHRVISSADENIDDDEISWDFVTGTPDSYDFYLKEHNDLSEGFFEEIPDGRLIKFIDDTIDSEWEGALVSAEVDATDSTLHILRVDLTSQIGSFTIGDDMRIEFEYQHSDILDDSIDDTKVDSNMSTAEKENFRDHIGAGLPGEATPAQETTVYESDSATFSAATPQNFTLTAGLDTFDSPGIIQMRFIQDFTDGSTDDDLRGLRAEAEFSLDIIKDLPIIADADFSTTAYENVVVERTIRLGTVDAPGDLQASTVAVGRKSNTELRIAASHALLDSATFEIKIIELKGSKGNVGDGTSVTTDSTLSGTGETTDVLGIADDGVDTDQIADDAVDTDQIADDAVDTDQIADDAVTQSKIADNSVGNPAMLSNAIGTTEIVNDAVTQAKLADNSVDSAQIALHAVETDEIADDAVTAAKIANNAVGASQISSLAVGTSELADGSVTTIKIANDAVNQSKIADDAVGNNQLADNAVNTDQIVDDAVTNAKIAARAVDTTEVENNAITSVQLADIAVATNKIVDQAVTTAKIDDEAVTTAKIDDEAVTTAKIDDGAVTQAKLADDAVGSDEIVDGSIREVHIASDLSDTEKEDIFAKLAVWLYDKKGPLIATSSVLPTTATTEGIIVTWTIDGDAPTGVAINSSETKRVNLPQVRPYAWCDGLIVEALVGTTVISDIKVTWGPGNAADDD